MKTYKITNNGESIKCLKCGLTSWNHNDIVHKYCGNCHEFHELDKTNEDIMKYEVKSNQDGWAIVEKSTGKVIETFKLPFYAHMSCAVLNE